MVSLDCAALTTRQINQRLEALANGAQITIRNPHGRHNLAVGLDQAVDITVDGHGGYYYGGMNKQARIVINGNVGPGVAENMMSGRIHVHGHASAAAGASAHGGLLIIDQDASIRCGISLKGGNIVVGGSVGNMCGFIAQLGTIVVCGNAAAGLGDSLYEAVVYVRGQISNLGADAQQEEMTPPDEDKVARLLDEAGFKHDPKKFKRVASAKTLYHFDAGSGQMY